MIIAKVHQEALSGVQKQCPRARFEIRPTVEFAGHGKWYLLYRFDVESQAWKFIADMAVDLTHDNGKWYAFGREIEE